LLHWTTLPIALFPDDIGAIWSGSVVVDDQNTSGLVPGGGLVAMYSYENQSQGIAYSQDKGRTWTKYAGNPVIPAMARNFRDPKIIWHAATERWVMVLAAGLEVQFWASPDLLTWEKTGDFSGGLLAGVWEVPDLFPLELNGKTHWVLLVSLSSMAPAGGSGIQYFIGDFDGQTFTVADKSQVRWLDYGADNYAGITFYNAPDDRRIYMGWMSNWLYAEKTPTAPWRGAMTLARELQLIETEHGMMLAQTPLVDFGARRELLGTWENVTLTDTLILEGIAGRTLEIIAEFEQATAERFGLEVHSDGTQSTRIVANPSAEKIFIRRTDTTADGFIAGFTPAFGAPVAHLTTALRLHLFLDESSVEVFIHDATIVLTSQTFVTPSADGVRLFAENGSVVIQRLEIYALPEIWSATLGDTKQASDFDFCR
jgi:fructan beta-fructosidase